MSEFRVIYEDESYLCHLQEVEGKAFFHVEVKGKLSLQDVRRGRKAFSKIKEEVANLGYERLFAATPSPHFAGLVGPGFSHLQTVHELELIVWELKPQ
ncbi:hypothetical protein D3C77_37750 [compost metagenome]